MSKHYQQVLDGVMRSRSIVSSYLPDSDQRVAEIEQKAKDSTLHVMLYGAYNAGKSSLINALLSEELATVNDIPTTDSIDAYPWQGMSLIDTPGVNAPIAHANVTEDHLKRCSVILFVIRDGDMDSQDVYDRLMDLIKRNKKIFILLNHQLSSTEDKEKAQMHIRSILLKKGAEHNIDSVELETVSITPVNVRTALKGRLQGQQNLVKYSGFSDFESAFDSWLIKQNQEKKKFDHFKNLVNETWYQPALNILQSQMSSVAAEKTQMLRQEKTSFDNQRSLMINEMRSMVQTQVISQKNRLVSVLQQGEDENKTRLNLEGIVTDISGQIESALQQKFDQVKVYLPKRNMDVSLIPERPRSGEQNILLDQSVAVAKKAIANKDNLKQALLLGRSLKIPIIKGRWEKTLGQWAGRAAIVVQVVTAVYDAYAAQKEQDEQNNAQKNYTLQLYQTVEEICSDINKDAYELVKGAVTDFFAPRLADIENEISQIKIIDDKKNNDLSLLNDMHSQMLSIEW